MFRSIKGLHSDDVIDPIARDIPHELLQFMYIMVFGSDAVHENLTGKKRKLLTVIQIIVNIQSEGKRLMPMCHLFGSSVLQITKSNTAIEILNRCGITTSYTTERRLEKEAAIALKHVAEGKKCTHHLRYLAPHTVHFPWTTGIGVDAATMEHDPHTLQLFSGMGMAENITPISHLQSLLVLQRKRWPQR